MFDDFFYEELLKTVCDNLDTTVVDDEMIRLFIILRYEMVSILWGFDQMKQNNDICKDLIDQVSKECLDYVDSEMTRLQSGILPQYINDFLQ